MCRGALILAFVMFASSVAAGDDNVPQGDARAVILKAIEAQGGKEVLDKYTAMVAKISGQTTSTGTSVSFVGAMAEALPGRFRIEMSFRIAGRTMTIAQAVLGDKVTQTMNGRKMEPDEFTKLLMLQTQRMQDVTMLMPLVETDRFKLTLEPDESVGDVETDVVKVQGEELPEIKLCFDKATGLLAKAEYMTITPGGKTALETTMFEDYRPTSGTVISMRQITLHDGKPYTSTTLEEIKLFEKLDDTWFTLK